MSDAIFVLFVAAFVWMVLQLFDDIDGGKRARIPIGA